MDLTTLTKILNLPDYQVTEIISISDTQMHLRIEPRKHKRKHKPALCSGCKQIHTQGYHSEKEVVVEDLAISARRVFLHVKKRLYRCPKDQRIYTEKIAWLNKRSRFTYRFSNEVNRLTAITTNQEAGWYLGLDDEVVYRIDKEMLTEQAKEKLIPTPQAIHLSVDEVSYKKYHRYLTNVIDLDRRLVIWNAKGRKSEVLDKYYQGLGEDCKKIASVALDGAKHYISSTKNALIVYDKFHVIQRLNQVVDRVRKEELARAREEGKEELVELTNCKQRFILLKNKNKLTEKQRGYLDKLYQINRPIYEAMLMNHPAASRRVSKIRIVLSVSDLPLVYLVFVYNFPL
jgi:transposase